MAFAPWECSAIPERVDLIPNGDTFRCLSCHVVVGGALNPFGEAVKQLVDEGSTDPFWSAELAETDSDGDGLSNGEELQDPRGLWQPGQDAPGDGTRVTNPGIAEGKPVAGSGRYRFARYVEPLGISTFCLMVLTALAGFFMPKNRKLLFRWHKRLAVTTILFALSHVLCVILSH